MKILSVEEVELLLKEKQSKHHPLFEELDKVEVGQGLFVPFGEWTYKSVPANALTPYCNKTNKKFKSVKTNTGYNIIRTE